MKNLYKALAAAQSELPAIYKDSQGVFGAYPSLEAVIETTKPVLAKHGLLITHTMSSPHVETAGGVAQGISMNTDLIHMESGEKISSQYLLIPEKHTPQGYGGAITYARRYCTLALLNLAAGDDPDAIPNTPQKPGHPGPQRAVGREAAGGVRGGATSEPGAVGTVVSAKKIATGKRFENKMYGQVPLKELESFASWLVNNVKDLSRYQLEFLEDVNQLKLELEHAQGDLNQQPPERVKAPIDPGEEVPF